MDNAIQSHMMSLGFSVDKASYDGAVKATANLEGMLTKFAQHAVYQFGRAALAVLGLEKAIKSVKMPQAGGHGGHGSGGHGGGNMSSEKTPGWTTPPVAPLKTFALNAVKYFGEASVAVTGFATAVAGATVSLLDNIGKQEIKTEMLARQLWTTQAQAQAFSYSLKALGASLQDLYLSPTLLAQYEKLDAVALKMQTPGDYNQQIAAVQNISLGFAQMQLEANYSLQWIGYYFIKYMSGPISKVNDVLGAVNDSIVKGMPVWTKQVASVMASFFQAGVYIVQALESVWKGLVKLANYVPGWAKGIALAIGVLTIAMDANPFGRLMLALSALFLLFDDFEAYIHKQKSALGPLWAVLVKFGPLLRGIGTILEGVAIAWGTYKAITIAWTTVTKTLMAVQTAWRSILIALGVATEADTAAQLGLNAAMEANPIGVIVTVIGVLIGLLILVISNWKQIEKWGVQAWDAIVSGAKKVWDWFTHLGVGAQTLIALIMPFIGIPALILAHWKPISTFFVGLWGDIKNGFANVLNFVISVFNGVVKAIDLIPGVKIPLIPLVQFGSGATSAVSYVLPQAAKGAKGSTVNMTVNNTIHGATDPKKTAAAVEHTFNRAYHNVKGVIG